MAMPGSTVLIVEDDPDVLTLLRTWLTSAGYRVVLGYGGEDGLRKAKRQQVDLILTDLAMPKVSGVDLIRQLREDPQRANIPVVCVTAYTWDTIGRTAAELGCAAFVNKPVDSRTLLQTIERCLADRPTLTD